MNNEPRAGMNLDPEMLAAYIDKRLTPEQRAAVEEQLAKDPDSYTVLVETMKALDDVQLPTQVPRVLVVRPRKVLRWAISAGSLAAAAVIALAIVQPDWLLRLRGIDPNLQRLIVAVGHERYIEARLTGGFRFGPLKRTTRGSDDLSARNLELLAAAGELQKRAVAEPTVANLHAWGVAQLLLGANDEAVKTLSGVRESAPRDAALLNDLATALLARATDGQHPEDIPLALEAVDLALDVAPNLPEPLFNRAFALEVLNMTEAAKAAWQAYLSVDSSSGWADEARQHLLRLSSRPGGAPLSRQFETPCVTAIVQSHRDGVMGGLAQRAQACLGEAQSTRDRQWLRFYESIGHYYQGDPAAAETLARSIEAEAVADIRGPLRYVIASLEFGQGKFGAALRTSDAAIPFLEDVDDSEGLVALHQLKGEILRAIGEPNAAWGEYITALGQLDPAHGAVRRHALLNSIGMAAVSQGLPRVAIDFLTVAEQSAAGASVDILRSEALLNRARAQQSLSDFSAAAADLDAAGIAASRARASGAAKRLETELHAAHAEFESTSDPNAAIAHARAALDGFNSAGVVIKRAKIHLALSRGLAALGHGSEAMEQLAAGIALVESQHASISTSRFRVSHLDSMWGLYGDYVTRLIDMGHEAEALNMLERGRRLKWSAPDSEMILPADDTLVLVYFETDAWLGRWALSSKGTKFAKIKIGVEELASNGSELGRVLQFANSLGESFSAAIGLSDLLLGDLDIDEQIRRVVVVSDGVLSTLPFSILANPATGLGLFETIDVVYSPTQGLFFSNDDRLTRALPPRSMVAFHPSNPNSGLPKLAGAAREVSEIVALYKDQIRVDGARASSEALTKALGTADVLHFAGHAVLDPSDPWRSRLVVAPGDGDERGSWMFSGASRPSRLPILVLAACSTAAGALGRGQTALSLGSLLVASGSPSVLATAWDIDDAAVTPLFVAFHRGLLSGLRPSAALRAAQNASRTPPRVWAALRVIGA
jgi:tetratricopeptide (TPR) repeat protein